MRFHAVALLLCVSCKSPGPAVAPAPELRTVELFANGATPSSPLIIALHGRGASPEELVDLWRPFPGKAQVALPQGPIPYGPGFAWFNWPKGIDEAQMGAEIAPAEAALWRSIQKVANGRKVIVMGFSQGAVMSFLLAARHPDDIRLAIPVAGALPSTLQPQTKSAPIFAMHGADDDVIPVMWGRAAVEGFQRTGANVELREYAGVKHTISPQMRDEMFKRVAALIEKDQH